MLGCDYVATGHYVISRDGGLYRGDPKKDQTYFLWGTPKEAIPHMLFPVGHLEKPQVRALAEQFGLPTAKKPESQNICFVQGDLKDFLAQHLTARPGPLIDLETGQQIGEHSGAQFYTVGQKKGLGLWKSHLERYVVQVNTATNEVIVGPKEACMWGGLEAREVNLLIEPENLPSASRCRCATAPAGAGPGGGHGRRAAGHPAGRAPVCCDLRPVGGAVPR